MKLAILSASILLELAGGASAQPGMTPPGMTPVLDYETPTAPAPAPAGEQLSEGHALALSLGGTALSWAMMIGAAAIPDDGSGVSALMGTAGAVGTVFAPSLGHWYADAYLTRGLGLRLGGLAVALAGGIVAFAEEAPLIDHGGESDQSGAVIGPAIAIIGAGMFVAGTIDDIVTAPRRVRRLNRERGAGVSLAPIVTQRSAGIALGGRF